MKPPLVGPSVLIVLGAAVCTLFDFPEFGGLTNSTLHSFPGICCTWSFLENKAAVRHGREVFWKSHTGTCKGRQWDGRANLRESVWRYYQKLRGYSCFGRKNVWFAGCQPSCTQQTIVSTNYSFIRCLMSTSCADNRYKRYKLGNVKDFSSLFFPAKPALLKILNHFDNKTGACNRSIFMLSFSTSKPEPLRGCVYKISVLEDPMPPFSSPLPLPPLRKTIPQTVEICTECGGCGDFDCGTFSSYQQPSEIYEIGHQDSWKQCFRMWLDPWRKLPSIENVTNDVSRLPIIFSANQIAPFNQTDQ